MYIVDSKHIREIFNQIKEDMPWHHGEDIEAIIDGLKEDILREEIFMPE